MLNKKEKKKLEMLVEDLISKRNHCENGFDGFDIFDEPFREGFSSAISIVLNELHNIFGTRYIPSDYRSSKIVTKNNPKYCYLLYKFFTNKINQVVFKQVTTSECINSVDSYALCLLDNNLITDNDYQVAMKRFKILLNERAGK